MIFQEPMTSLNPVFTCGDQVAESIQLHKKISIGEAKTTSNRMVQKSKIAGAGKSFFKISTSIKRWAKATGDDRNGNVLQTFLTYL